MLHYNCPGCQSRLESFDSEAGIKVSCPTCGQKMRVPLPSKSKTIPAERDDDEPLPRRRRYNDDRQMRYDDDDDEGDRPTRFRKYDDDDDEDHYRPRRRDRTCECPNCGCLDIPFERKQIATEGWVVMVVLIVTFWPLFFLGLLMKNTFLICRECGFKIRKVGGITFG